MQSKVVGFFGSDSYDLVHFLARTLQTLGTKVLVIDYTEEQVMTMTLPTPVRNDIVDYQGVAFASCTTDLTSQGFDYVFMYYGFCESGTIFEGIEEVYFVIDCQMQSIAKLKKLDIHEEQFRGLIVRNTVPERDILNYVQLELNKFEFGEKNTYVVPFSKGDISAMLSVQYDSVYRFDTVSNQVLNFITDFCSLDFPRKDVQAAIKIASKGVRR